jgi:recombination protein RecA
MSKELDKIVTSTLKKSSKIFQDASKAGTLQKIPTDSPQINFLFSGGITIGRMHRFRGPESSGKSTACNYLAGQLQRKLPTSGFYGVSPEQRYVVYVDWERSFDMNYAAENGLICDEDHLIYMTPESIEDFSDAIIPMIKTGELAAIIFDSDAAACTRAMWVDESGKATFGGQARALGECLRKLVATISNYKTTLFWISQERVNMTPMSHLPNCTGGEAPKFYASTVNRATKTDVIKNGNDVIGITMRIRNYKNKCGIAFRDANVKLYYKGGFKPDEEYIDFLLAFDIIKQKGAYFYVPGEDKSLQGRVKLQDWLNEHPKDYEEMKRKVNETILHSNALDANKEEIEETAADMSNTEISEDILNEA